MAVDGELGKCFSLAQILVLALPKPVFLLDEANLYLGRDNQAL